jgi:hypothetical protein
MKVEKQLIAKCLLVLLTFVGLLSAYQVCFCVWMTAYPPAAPYITQWRHLLVIRLLATAVTTLLWIAIASWLIRNKRLRAKIGGL